MIEAFGGHVQRIEFSVEIISAIKRGVTITSGGHLHGGGSSQTPRQSTRSTKEVRGRTGEANSIGSGAVIAGRSPEVFGHPEDGLRDEDE